MPVRVINMGNGQSKMRGTRIPDVIEAGQGKADTNKKQEAIFFTPYSYFGLWIFDFGFMTFAFRIPKSKIVIYDCLFMLHMPAIL